MIPIIEGIAPLCEARKALLVDIWGVMHNGVVPFAGAVDACCRFRARGGVVLLLSNAPRPEESVAEQLDRIGVAQDAYDSILSSGDASREMIAALGPIPVFHLGPARDRALFTGAFKGTLSEADDADAIVCSGLFDDETETPDDYRPLLENFLKRRAPMVCANPDLRVERAGKLVYCAGALARLYESLGGEVRYAGKPFAPIYQLAMSRVSNLKREPIATGEVLAIGDGVHTDILGAGKAGIDSVFIASAVHVSSHELTTTEVDEIFASEPHPPIAAMQRLAW